MYKYACMVGYMYVLVCTCVYQYAQMYVCMNACKDARKDACIDGWMDGYLDGRINEYMNEFMNGWIDVCTNMYVVVCMYIMYAWIDG